MATDLLHEIEAKCQPVSPSKTSKSTGIESNLIKKQRERSRKTTKIVCVRSNAITDRTSGRQLVDQPRFQGLHLIDKETLETRLLVDKSVSIKDATDL